MKIARRPKDTGPAAWNRLLGAPSPATPLEADISADWLVIGAGFAGLAAAQRLRQNAPGDRIAVLDAVGIGEGPVGRNSGFMIDLPHVLSTGSYSGQDEGDAAEIWANRTAIRFAMDAAEKYGLPDEAVVLAGKVNGAASAGGDTHNRDYARHLDSMSEPYELLDARQMQDLTGSSYYSGGLYTPGTAMLQPALYARGVAEGLRQNGVQIHDMSPVISLDRSGGAWSARTPKGRVTAPCVILAVNGHVESFGRFSGRLMHVMLYASMTRALTGDEAARLAGEATWGVTPSDPMGSTLRRISGIGGDRIIVRNRCVYTPSMETSDSKLKSMARDHDRAFAARFPSLPNVSMEHRWAGRLCLSLNDAPAFGEVDEGLISACCQNGLGASKGTFNGIAAADLANGNSGRIVDHQLAQPAPKRLMPGLLMRIGAAMTIRAREIAAGREL